MSGRRRGRQVLLVLVMTAAALIAVRVIRRGPRRIVTETAPRPPAGGVADADDASAAATDAGPAFVEDGRRYRMRRWSFPLDRWEMTIEDAGMTTALDVVLERVEGTGAHVGLVVNGGFFDPDGKPVGLALSRGALISKLKPNLSGGVLASDGAHAELFPVEGFALGALDGGVFALQCRPRLVVDAGANVKSDDGKRAERSALCVRDGGRTVDVVVVRGSEDGEIAGPSLFALASELASAGCEAALNLDGGPSTGVAWREGQEAAAPIRLLAPRAPVRHVVAFRARE